MGLFDAFRKKKPASSDNVSTIMVTLEIAGDQCLFVLLSEDGTINRLGTGAEDNDENGFFIGLGDLAPFNRVRSLASPVIDKWVGGYEAPNQEGKPCKLVVGFQTNDAKELMSQWEYGTQSQGPPPEVAELVIAAVNATDSWWEKQKAVAAGNS